MRSGKALLFLVLLVLIVAGGIWISLQEAPAPTQKVIRTLEPSLFSADDAS